MELESEEPLVQLGAKAKFNTRKAKRSGLGNNQNEATTFDIESEKFGEFDVRSSNPKFRFF